MVGLMTENEFVRHMPCNNCGSSDGNSLYSDGHTYCFVCHERTGGDNDVIHNRNVSKTVHLTGSADYITTGTWTKKAFIEGSKIVT